MVDDVDFFRVQVEVLTPKMTKGIVGKTIPVDKDDVLQLLQQVFIVEGAER